MAALALGVVGAGIGSAFTGTFLGMSFASIGFSLGSMAGNMLFAPKMPDQFGPRLGDLKVQASTYGNPIPIVYGAMRVAGNVIWSADIAETSHTTTSGGKGGGGGVTQTSYTYSQSFAIALCEGEIAGVRKIWANGKLIYNLSDTADIATIVASNKSASGIRIYTGSETQTADSLMQAYIGAADTPAYRGTAYVVFENMQLADYGNRAPNLEFEVVRAGSYAHLVGSVTNYATPAAIYGIAFDPITKSVWATYGSATVSKFNAETGSRIDYVSGASSRHVVFDPVTNSVWSSNFGDATVSKINILTGAKVDYASGAYPWASAFDSTTNSVWVANFADNTVSKINVYDGTKAVISVGIAPYAVAFDPSTKSVWVANSGAATVSKINVVTGARIDYAVGTDPRGVAFDSTTNSIWVSNYTSATVSKINVVTGAKFDYATGAGPNGIAFDSISDSIWVTRSDTNIDKFNVADGTKVSFLIGDSTFWSAFDSSTDSVWFSVLSGTSFLHKVAVQDYGISNTAPTLSSIVSNICTRAGLTTGQIDVTALTDTVDGYVVQRGTARSQIEQLMQAFYFDAVESDGKIKFVKRGGAAVLNIPEDDLAAHAYGSTMPDNLVTTRKQEMELPLEFNVQYMDSSAAYLVNTQRSKRLTTSSQNKVSVNLAIAMAATKAKQISDVLMYDAWTGRTSFSFSTGWKYSYLEPTDVITVTKGSSTYTVRVASDDLNVGISGRTAVLEDNTVYTQTAAAVEAPAPINTVSTVPLTDLLLLDIPLLRDQDDAVGFYAAACGYGAGWKGAQGFKSNDGGATWNSYGNAFLNAASIGTAAGALGTFSSGNIFDETNTVSVVLINGTLSSDTELNVLNGANVALLGNEIIQFKNATLTATSTYTLSGLLRGRQGTEWAMTTHAAGDRFVLLSSTTTYLFPASSAEYNLARKYRGVSIGGFLADATTIDFTNTAAAQKPLSPVQIGAGRNAALDITINWVRRTRLGGGWNNYSDVPLGETTESYSIDIMQGATVKRTLTSSTPTVQYTSAQQVTDFGGNQASLLVNVYQISATVGRGFVGIATV